MPLAHPEQAAIVSSPRIFNDLTAPRRTAKRLKTSPPRNGRARARARRVHRRRVRPRADRASADFIEPMLDSVVQGARRHRRADRGRQRRAARRAAREFSTRWSASASQDRGPTQCHDITVYPAIGLAGGACDGYGLLLDIHDPAHPMRLGAVADSNFSYWHSATFNNDGTKVLFSDEWGGGGAAQVPRHRQARVGRRRDLHARRTARCTSRATTRCRRRRRRTRTASRTTARSSRFRAAT